MYEEGGRPGRNGHLSGELTTTSLADTLPGSLPGVQRGSSPLLPHPLHPPLSPVTKQGLTTAFLLVPPPRSSSLPCGRYHGLRQQVAQSLVSEIFIHLFFFSFGVLIWAAQENPRNTSMAFLRPIKKAKEKFTIRKGLSAFACASEHSSFPYSEGQVVQQVPPPPPPTTPSRQHQLGSHTPDGLRSLPCPLPFVRRVCRALLEYYVVFILYCLLYVPAYSSHHRATLSEYK